MYEENLIFITNLKESHGIFSWDNLLVTATEEYLQEFFDNSNLLSADLYASKLNIPYDQNFHEDTAYTNHPKSYSNEGENGKVRKIFINFVLEQNMLFMFCKVYFAFYLFCYLYSILVCIYQNIFFYRMKYKLG